MYLIDGLFILSTTHMNKKGCLERPPKMVHRSTLFETYKDCRMKIVEEIRNDKEIQQLKREYKEKHNKNAPPFNYDQYASIEDYKNKLRKMVK